MISIFAVYKTLNLKNFCCQVPYDEVTNDDSRIGSQVRTGGWALLCVIDGSYFDGKTRFLLGIQKCLAIARMTMVDSQ